MKKYFIVTDVHGFYDEMMEALNEAGFEIDNPNHIFVSLGDLLDRGRQPYMCLNFVNSLPKERKILIYGNHEQLMEDAIGRGAFFWHDIYNGTVQTVNDLYATEFDEDEDAMTTNNDKLIWLHDYKPYREYINSTQQYAVVGKNIFVHGWVPHYIHDLTQIDDVYPGDWKEAAWKNGMKEYETNGPVYCDANETDICTVFCGHWHTFWWRTYVTHENFGEPSEELLEHMTWEERKHFFRPVIEPGLVALDACTAFSDIINCYVLEE